MPQLKQGFYRGFRAYDSKDSKPVLLDTLFQGLDTQWRTGGVRVCSYEIDVKPAEDDAWGTPRSLWPEGHWYAFRAIALRQGKPWGHSLNDRVFSTAAERDEAAAAYVALCASRWYQRL